MLDALSGNVTDLQIGQDGRSCPAPLGQSFDLSCDLRHFPMLGNDAGGIFRQSLDDGRMIELSQVSVFDV